MVSYNKKKIEPMWEAPQINDVNSFSLNNLATSIIIEEWSKYFQNDAGDQLGFGNYVSKNSKDAFEPTSTPKLTPYRKTLANMARSEMMKFKKESLSELDSFHRAMNKMIIIAQWFGFMPVIGIKGRNTSRLRFKWLSVRVIYTIVSLMEVAFMTALCIKRFYKYDRSFKETQCTLFYGCSFLRALLFLSLARHWPTLSSIWEQVEIDLAHYGYPRRQHRKFGLITALILFVAFLEHVLSHIRVLRLAVLCAVEDKMDGICTFFFNSFPHVFDYVPCSLGTGIFIFIVNMKCAFGWTFVDLFIILISTALADRFKQLNRCLKSVEGQTLSPEFWHQIRMDYNNLASLVKTVDSYISKIIFLSYANNLYSICMQLLNSLHPPENAAQMFYFCLSFGFILVRIAAVSLCAANVNEQSNHPRALLYSVPSSGFSTEVDRFLQQVTTDDVVLTGMSFFSVTRTLLLTVIGTMVTYELILVQFSGIHADERDLAAHSVAKRYCF